MLNFSMYSKFAFIFFSTITFLLSNPWEKKKQQMIDTLIQYGIQDKNVLDAMSKVPRHEFVPKAYKSYSYEDTPLPIGFGQTISQPYIVAYMTEQLDVKKKDVVLEIGTGSGYQAAVLSLLAKEIYTIEIVPELCERSKKTLKQLGYNNVFVICGDGYKGYPDKAPFDRILLTAAPEKIPEILIQQLKDNGILVGPAGKIQELQYLYKIQKINHKIIEKKLIPVRFVPMVKPAK
jgi:protein-L-isoaspartate(D-aspartate) O-methyltransferase